MRGHPAIIAHWFLTMAAGGCWHTVGGKTPAHPDSNLARAGENAVEVLSSDPPPILNIGGMGRH
eukprot:4100833-Pyramimonas_sp.AAC.1